MAGDSLSGGPGEACQLRIYTINKGMMEPWVKLHTESMVPLNEKHGITVEESCVNEDNNQYIWIRTFDNPEDVEAKEAALGSARSGKTRGTSFSVT